jgi:hypothetical protein
MVSSNTETGIAVSYDDADNTLDFVIGDDAIVQSMIADDAIDSQHYVDGSIDLVHMSINSIDSDQYVDGSIDLVHMSANSVDSDQYVDGSIDLIHMSANSVDSDQYVDGSIDTVHLADDAVTGAKLADNIDIAGTLDVTGILTADSNVVVAGNLTVNGTTTTLNTATLDVEDKNITINYGAGDTSASANGAGITIQDAIDASNDATILWDTTNDEFDFSHAINVAGNIAVSGTVDGRDVATDGTKLDGIESSATADQTAAEIRTAVEAATDSNVFTDADHTKLNAIEALADVTDATNVTAAGALMDSELTSIASVKALNQGVATTDSPTFVNVTGTSLDISGDIDVDGTTNLDVVDIDGALTQDGGAVFNEASADADFRVESNDNENMLFVDGGLNIVSVGSSSVYQSGALEVFAQSDASSQGVSINGADSATSFRLYTVGDVATIGRGGDNPAISISTGNAVTINENSLDADFRVESNDNANMLFVDGGNNRVGIGTASVPANRTLQVSSSDIVPIEATSSGGETIISLDNTATNGRNYFLISGGTAGTYAGGKFGIFDADAAADRMSIDSSGNVTFNEGSVDMDFRVESNDNANMLFVDGGNNRVGIGKAAASQPFEVGVSAVFDKAVIVNETGADEDFRVESDANAHALFVDASVGTVLFGGTSAFSYDQTSGNGVFGYALDNGSDYGSLMVSNNADRGWSMVYANKFGYTEGDDRRYIAWYVNGGALANLQLNAAGTQVEYNTGSDRRLKENIVDIDDGIVRLKQMQPRKYTWVGTDFPAEGFIADEADGIVPEAVKGEVGAVDDEGNPIYQQIEYSRYVPLLTAALKEAVAKIEALEARITALES